MVHDTCAMWLGEYHMDALRFDSIKDVPVDAVQVRGGGREGDALEQEEAEERGVPWSRRRGRRGGREGEERGRGVARGAGGHGPRRPWGKGSGTAGAGPQGQV
jgi:hypothetical protein